MQIDFLIVGQEILGTMVAGGSRSRFHDYDKNIAFIINRWGTVAVKGNVNPEEKKQTNGVAQLLHLNFQWLKSQKRDLYKQSTT